MCISALLETDRERLADYFGVTQIAGADDPVARRAEPGADALVMRLVAGGRLGLERVRFSGKAIRVTDIAEDPIGEALVGQCHGIMALNAFSDWARTDLLVGEGVAEPHDVCCAFNRYAPDGSRRILANFYGAGGTLLLVPVLIWVDELIVLTQEAQGALTSIGIATEPVQLNLDQALAWLDPPDGGTLTEALAPLQGKGPEPLALRLYKSA